MYREYTNVTINTMLESSVSVNQKICLPEQLPHLNFQHIYTSKEWQQISVISAGMYYVLISLTHMQHLPYKATSSGKSLWEKNWPSRLIKNYTGLNPHLYGLGFNLTNATTRCLSKHVWLRYKTLQTQKPGVIRIQSWTQQMIFGDSLSLNSQCKPDGIKVHNC